MPDATPQNDQFPGPPIADAIDQLRSELSEAFSRGEGERLRFRLEAVTVEFELGVSQSKEGAAGVKFWVVSADGSVQHHKASTNRIVLQLMPELDGAAKPLISHRRLERAPTAPPETDG